jgi:hypothetical protein
LVELNLVVEETDAGTELLDDVADLGDIGLLTYRVREKVIITFLIKVVGRLGVLRQKFDLADTHLWEQVADEPEAAVALVAGIAAELVFGVFTLHTDHARIAQLLLHQEVDAIGSP